MTETQPAVFTPEVVTAVAIAPTQQPTMSMLAWWKPRNPQEAFVLAEKLAETDLVPKEYYRKPNNILIAMIFGQELGLSLLSSLTDIKVINGKPSLYGDGAMAVARGHPDFEDIQEVMEGAGDERKAVCIVKRRGQSPTRREFGVRNAKNAALWMKSGPWTQYPDRMMQMRARGFALRDAFADALKGFVTAEEAQDYPSEAERRWIPPAPPPTISKDDRMRILRAIEAARRKKGITLDQLRDAMGRIAGRQGITSPELTSQHIQLLESWIEAYKPEKPTLPDKKEPPLAKPLKPGETLPVEPEHPEVENQAAEQSRPTPESEAKVAEAIAAEEEKRAEHSALITEILSLASRMSLPTTDVLITASDILNRPEKRPVTALGKLSNADLQKVCDKMRAVWDEMQRSKEPVPAEWGTPVGDLADAVRKNLGATPSNDPAFDKAQPALPFDADKPDHIPF